MSKFNPFKGYRYKDYRNLEKFVCPPYDVVTPQERRYYANLSEFNAIHVELPDPDNPNRYIEAANLFKSWVNNNIVFRDQIPCFYGYQIKNNSEDAQRTITGVIGAIKLENPGSWIIPHEQTIEKDKTDRLELLKATQLNTSPIWLLSQSTNLTETILATRTQKISTKDKNGDLHTYWPINQQDKIQELSTQVSENTVIIADGHHRFQTALTYCNELKAAEGHPSQFVMAFVVELSEGSVKLKPIHRVIDFSVGLKITELANNLELLNLKKYQLSEISELDLRRNQIGVAINDEVYLYESTKLTAMLPSEFVAEVLSRLNSTIITYANSIKEATDYLLKGSAVILLPAVSVNDLRTYAADKKLMPPKSTFFTPKPLTGIVFRELS